MKAWSSKQDRAPSKSDVAKWLKQTAKNDKDHGRNNPKNPNNKKNGKW
jgi:hypothetical protein